MKLPTDPHARSPVRVRLSQAEALFALVLCGCALAACGSSNSSSAPYASRQNAQRINQQLKFNQCMRAHGVNVPDPSESGGNGFGQKLLAASRAPNFQPANKACRGNLPGVLGGTGG